SLLVEESMRHIAVTGGAGFIGTNFVRFLLKHRPDWTIHNFDALTYSGNLENLADLDGNSRYRFIKGDVRDAGAMEALVSACDAVVHMAAESHVDRSIMDSGPFVQTNVAGTQVVLDAVRHAHKAGRKVRMVYVSTDEVYGSLPLD